MTDNLVNRLREAHNNSQQRILGSNIFQEAADHIEALSAENAKLLERCDGYKGQVRAGSHEIQQLRLALYAIIDLDHHNMGPESRATTLARSALKESGA